MFEKTTEDEKGFVGGKSEERDYAEPPKKDFSGQIRPHLISILILNAENEKDLSIVSIAGKFKEMYGYEADEIIGNDISILEPSENRGSTKEVLLSSKTNYIRAPMKRRSKDGRTLTVLSKYVRYDIGGIRHYLGMEEDLESLRLNEEGIKILQTAVDQSSNIIMITDPDGNILYVNHTFERITGYSFDEVRGKNPRILKSDVHEDEFYIKMWDRIKSGKTWRGEIVNRRKDGTLYIENMTITPVMDNGEIKAYIAIKEDITRDKKIKQELLRLKKERSREHINNMLLSVLMLLFRFGGEQVIGELVAGLGDMLEERLKPNFERYMETECTGTFCSKKERYLIWLGDFFSDIGVSNHIELDSRYFVVHECPWNDLGDEISPCIICRTIISRTFDWSGEKGRWIQKKSLAYGDDNCLFEFKFQRRN